MFFVRVRLGTVSGYAGKDNSALIDSSEWGVSGSDNFCY